MTMKGEDPEILRLVVGFLRFLVDQTQKAFAEAAGLSQTDVSRYESGLQKPSEKNLRRMAAVAGVPWTVVAHLRRFYGAMLPLIRGRSGERGAQPKEERLERAILEPLRLAVATYRAEEQAQEERWQSPSELKYAAEQTWQALACFPVGRRRQVADLLPESCRTRELAERLCEASLKAASNSSVEALELATLALGIAENAAGEERPRLCLEGWCWGHLGNARRVATDFVGADEAFTRTWQLWGSGEPPEPRWLPEWRLLSFEASLRRAQRRFPEALDLLELAMAKCEGDPAAIARCLLQKEHVFEVMGDIPAALVALAQARLYVDEAGAPHLLFAHRFNMAADLCHLQRFEEVVELLPEIGELAYQQGADLDSLRVDWLAARVAAGLGKKEEAMTGLEKVGQRFTDLKLPYEAALSSLELAVLWLEAGRTAEVKELARAMAWIFNAKGIQGEALAALQLFREAALREAATVELARRVIQEIETARRSAPCP